MAKKVKASSVAEITNTVNDEKSFSIKNNPFNNSHKPKTGKVKKVEERKLIASSYSVPFQGVPLPFTVENHEQLNELEICMNQEIPVVLVPVRNPELRPSTDNLCDAGVEMKVLKIIDLPDGKKNAFLLGGDRIVIESCRQVGDSVFQGLIKLSPDSLRKEEVERFNLIMELVIESYEYVKSYFSEMAKVQMAAPKDLQDDRRAYLNFIIITSPLDFKEREALLTIQDLVKRAENAYIYLEKVKQHIDLRKEIFSKAAADIDKEQRDHFLRTQIREIQNEIGEGAEGDLEILSERAQEKEWNEETRKAFNKELAKLSRFSPNSPDYAIQFTYLDTILNLPWNKIIKNDIDISQLEQDLDREHYGLNKIKERIIEHIAVLKLKGDMRSPILCLYGPPGVGKTSLCKSIADSLGREYARISLGGLHDETQLRGHRRTYIGALPGRIISALEKIDSNNPVFVLDEIDKIGNDHRGDPAQALLEVLDPEQNSKFHDNYLDLDYDLSKIFFIATANTINGIAAPLLDRMELIDVSGYIIEEKIEIAQRHLIPKLLENHGFKKKEISFTNDAIKAIIEYYTRESGVRKLEKTIARVLRKIAVKKAKGERYPKKLTEKSIITLLGKEERIPEIYTGNLPVGVTAGLAWTAVGGEILYFEAALSKGKGILTLTGNLGDVMKESATIALQWIKSNSERLGIDDKIFAETDVHLHVPEGAVPKDGPSAGITMVCAMVSVFKNRRCNNGFAMTGEATLSGRVLPVGGIKEKVLAAKRAGITDIIISKENKRDVEEIESIYLDGVKFHYVENIMEVISLALDEGE